MMRHVKSSKSETGSLTLAAVIVAIVAAVAGSLLVLGVKEASAPPVSPPDSVVSSETPSLTSRSVLALSTFVGKHGEKRRMRSTLPPQQLASEGENSLIQIGVTFVNFHAVPLKLYWISYKGNLKLDCDLKPGESCMVKGFSGHLWVFKNESGEVVRYFSVPESERGSFVVYSVLDSDLNSYWRKTRRIWRNVWPRDPPVFPLWNHETGTSQQVEFFHRGLEQSWNVESLAQIPAVFQVVDFFSLEECQNIVDLANSKLQDVKDNTVLIPVESDALLRSAGSRLLQLLRIPLRQGLRSLEPVRFIKLTPDHAEQIKRDWHDPYNKFTSQVPKPVREGKNRFVSVLVFLSRDPRESGGNLAFPSFDALYRRNDTNCSNSRLLVNAKPGKVVFWYNMLEDGNLDEYAESIQCAITSSELWVAKFWIWEPSHE